MNAASTAAQLFPSRKSNLTEAHLKRELTAKGVSAGVESTVLLQSELNILRDLVREHSTAVLALQVDDTQRIAQAADRKQKMIQLDEDRRAKGAILSMEDLEKEAQRSQDVHVARRKQEESIDEVKHMNQVMLYAKCVTVRDAQILEKKAITAEKVEEERRQDMMMELERLKALRMYEEREIKRIEDRKKGAAVIRAQIEEREQERLRKIELRQQEQEAMLRHIDTMKVEDRSDAVRKKDTAKRLMEDVALANAEQIRLKSRQHEMEEEENRQISVYLAEKEHREQELSDELKIQKQEKELEIARLRSQQEKAQDKQAELDALRARRAQEAHEREYRQKEKESHIKLSSINEDLSRARGHQKQEKELLLTEQARIEQEEFERIIAVQKTSEETEGVKRQKEHELRKANSLAVQKQITEIEEQRRKERRDQLEEGNKIALEKRDRESTVETIRLLKIEELDKLQVPKQYRQELLKKRANEPLRPSK